MLVFAKFGRYEPNNYTFEDFLHYITLSEMRDSLADLAHMASSKPDAPMITMLGKLSNSFKSNPPALWRELEAVLKKSTTKEARLGELNFLLLSYNSAIRETEDLALISAYEKFLIIVDHFKSNRDEGLGVQNLEELSPKNKSLANLSDAWLFAGGGRIDLGQAPEALLSQIMADTDVSQEIRLSHHANMSAIYQASFEENAQKPERVEIKVQRQDPAPAPRGHGSNSNFILQCLSAGVAFCAGALLLLTFAAPGVALSFGLGSVLALRFSATGAAVMGGLGFFALRRQSQSAEAAQQQPLSPASL